MAKKTVKENQEKPNETKAMGKGDPKVMYLDDLVQQLRDKEKLKTVIENQYQQLCGQIQLLFQQISSLKETKDKS